MTSQDTAQELTHNLTPHQLLRIKGLLSEKSHSTGFEFHPFKIGWYNSQVEKAFQIDQPHDTLAYCVVSTPSMFEKIFIPYILDGRRNPEASNDIDPLDSCMKHHLQSISDKCSNLLRDLLSIDKKDDNASICDIEVLHDFDLHANRKPKILVQTAGHVAGAACYYQRKDIRNPPWEEKRKIYGTCIHPKYSGWFAFRGVLLFSRLNVSFLRQKPPPAVLNTDNDPDDKMKIDVLSKLNDNWMDFQWRSIPKTDETYSPFMREYLLTGPKKRHQLVEKLRREQDKSPVD